MRTTCVTSSGESASPSTGPTCTSCTTSTSPPRTTRTSPWSRSSPWTGRADRPPPHSPSPGHLEKGGRACELRLLGPGMAGLASHPLSARKTKGSCLSVTVVTLRMEGRETRRLGPQSPLENSCCFVSFHMDRSTEPFTGRTAVAPALSGPQSDALVLSLGWGQSASFGSF